MTGRLAQNVMHFARILRASGLAIGPDRIGDALNALTLSGLDHRDDVKAALAAVLTQSREDRPIFDEAFRIFWRDPDLESKVRALLLPKVVSRVPNRNVSTRCWRLLTACMKYSSIRV